MNSTSMPAQTPPGMTARLAGQAASPSATALVQAPPVAVSAAAAEIVPAARRLVVLVPGLSADDASLAQQIWALASPRQLAVLYLGLCADSAHEPGLRRRLTTLAALTRDAWVSVETRLDLGTNWIRSVKGVWQAGDIVVCHAEQRTGFWRRPLSRALVSTLDGPVCTLAGFYPQPPGSERGPLAGALWWTVPLATVAIFFWLQVRLDRLPGDWAHTLLLYVAVLVEAGVLWLWHQSTL